MMRATTSTAGGTTTSGKVAATGHATTPGGNLGQSGPSTNRQSDRHQRDNRAGSETERPRGMADQQSGTGAQRQPNRNRDPQRHLRLHRQDADRDCRQRHRDQGCAVRPAAHGDQHRHRNRQRTRRNRRRDRVGQPVAAVTPGELNDERGDHEAGQHSGQPAHIRAVMGAKQHDVSSHGRCKSSECPAGLTDSGEVGAAKPANDKRKLDDEQCRRQQHPATRRRS